MRHLPHGRAAPLGRRHRRRALALRTLSTACALAGAGLLTCAPTQPATSPQPAERSAAGAAAKVAPGPAASGASNGPSACTADRHGVVAENDTAAAAAMDALAKGGSAADAVVAGLLTAGVAQPVSSGLGGGGFALYYSAADRKVTVLDFREVAPRGLRQADYDRRPPPWSRRGVMVGVPGEVAGLTELHRRWGKLPLGRLAGRAAQLADEGVPISRHMQRALRWNRTWVVAAPRYAAVFAPLGALLATSGVAKNPALAGTLRRIATEGRAGFYEGAIAQDIVDTAGQARSRLTKADLQAYRVVERTALHGRYEGHDVYTMPPPSAGGVLLLQALQMHAAAELRALGYGTGPYLHLLAETFRGSTADRIRAIGDPAFVELDPARLAAPARMKARRQRIDLDRSQPAPAFPLAEAGTSHLAAIDAEGNVACVTSTVNNMFGAKLVTAGGFPLNDELDDFSTPELDQHFDATARPNRPRPGARPVSSMTPTIVLKDGQPVMALGGSGGTRIPTGVTQVLLARLAFHRPIEQAISDHRIHTPPAGGLWIEASASQELRTDLLRRGEPLIERRNYSSVGGLVMTRRVGCRHIEGSADPRKGGSARVRTADGPR